VTTYHYIKINMNLLLNSMQNLSGIFNLHFEFVLAVF
jgi:hypothetical protein